MTERSPRGQRRPNAAHDEGAFPGGLFAVACPACGKSLAARVRDAGRAVKCPCCAAGLLLPAAARAAATEAAEARPAERRIPTVPPASSGSPADAMQPARPAADEDPRSAAVGQSAAPAAADGVPGLPVDAALPTFDIPPDLLEGMPGVIAAVSDVPLAVGDSAKQEQAQVRDRHARELRRARRSLLMLVIGSAILLGIVFFLTGFGGRR